MIPAAADRPGPAPRVPLRRAAVAQCAAWLLVLVLARLLAPPFADDTNLLGWAVLQGVVAALIGRLLRMEGWWLLIHVLFSPGLVLALEFGASPLYPLAAFLLLVFLYGGVLGTRVPLYLSSRSALSELAALLPRRSAFAFVDLGCGMGGVLHALARVRADGVYTGVETAMLPFLLARLRAWLAGGSFGVRWADWRQMDLGAYDVVYAYLSPAAMPGLWEQARRQMRPGSVLISNSFEIPGAPAAATVSTGERDGCRLLLWRI